MSDEIKGLEGKSIIVHEDVMPRQVNGELIYPRAYFESDVNELIKRVKSDIFELIRCNPANSGTRLVNIIKEELKNNNEDEEVINSE